MISTGYRSRNRIILRPHFRVLYPALLLTSSFLFVLLLTQSASPQQYYNSFSSMLDKSSMWRNRFYNDVIRATSGSFGSVSSAQQVTQEEIQNLCKPFPCSGPKPSIMSSQPPPASYPQAPAYSPPPPQYPIAATDFRPAGGRIMPRRRS